MGGGKVIWTKSKRTTVFSRENVPNLRMEEKSIFLLLLQKVEKPPKERACSGEGGNIGNAQENKGFSLSGLPLRGVCDLIFHVGLP